MTTKAIREKLLSYISSADDKKIKAMYTLLEAEINPIDDEWGAELEQELMKRSESYKNGSAKTYTWEETKAAAIAKYNQKAK